MNEVSQSIIEKIIDVLNFIKPFSTNIGTIVAMI